MPTTKENLQAKRVKLTNELREVQGLLNFIEACENHINYEYFLRHMNIVTTSIMDGLTKVNNEKDMYRLQGSYEIINNLKKLKSTLETKQQNLIPEVDETEKLWLKAVT